MVSCHSIALLGYQILLFTPTYLNPNLPYATGGYWMPYAINDDDRVVGWGKDSYDHFLSVLNSADGAKAGTPSRY